MWQQAQEWGGATTVALVAVVLIVLDVSSSTVRRFWLRHEFTASVVAGMLVLAITLLIANRVVNARRLNDRKRAIAAQGAIVMAQARRAGRAVTAALQDPAERESASEELRTYMTMLLISAPVLLEARTSRAFLEDAQRLAGELARALYGKPANDRRQRLRNAVEAVRASGGPLIDLLSTEERTAVADTADAESEPAGP